MQDIGYHQKNAGQAKKEYDAFLKAAQIEHEDTFLSVRKEIILINCFMNSYMKRQV